MNTLAIPRKPASLQRSGLWSETRRKHLAEQSYCQACGTTQRLTVHHITPVHVNRKLELNEDNLITLCENPGSGYCHYIFGHLAISWWKWDPDVVTHAAQHKLAVTAAKETQDARGRPIG